MGDRARSTVGLGALSRAELDRWASAAAGDVRALEGRIMRARWVADHWRKAAFDRDGMLAHPLCMVLAALDGAKRPEDLGVERKSKEGRLLAEIEDD